MNMKFYKVLGGFLLLTAVLITAGIFYYRNQLEDIKSEKEKDLSITAQFKVLHLNIWLKERIDFGNSIINNSYAIKSFYKMVIDNREGKKPENNNEFFNSYIKNFEYKEIFLLNNNYDNVFSTSHNMLSNLKQITNDRTNKDSVSVSCIFLENNNELRFAVVVPLKYAGENFGWIIAALDPAQELKPFIELSPNNINTFSTGLIFSNPFTNVYSELAFTSDNNNREFNVRSLDRLTTKSIHNLKTYVEGTDYNGVDKLSYALQIPNTSMYIITKINKSEILNEAGVYAQSAISFIVLSLSLSVVLFIAIKRKSKISFYKKEYEFEKEKNMLLKHYDYLSKYANDIILLTDYHGNIKQANEKAIAAYGYTLNELYQMSARNLRPEEIRAEFDSLVNKLHGENGTVYETIHQRKDGKKFPVEISVRPFKIDDNVFLQAIIRDITERKKAEETIWEHSLMLDAVAQSVAAVDLQGKIIYWNVAAEELYGWQKNEILGKSLLKVVPTEIRKIQLARVMKKLYQGENWTGELNVTGRDRNKFPIKITCTPIYDTNKELIAFIGISENLTEQKRREKELLLSKEKAEELSKLKSSFLANMSHEIRTPLIGILGYAEMIMEENYDSELKEKISVIYKSGKKLNETLDTILDISRIEADKVDIKYEKFNLGDLVKESVTLYKVFAEEKSLALKYFGGTNGLQVELDRNILSKILNNLLSNAIKYTHTGEVIVSTSCNNRRLKIIIEDTGIGIPADKLNIIFEPFRQVSEGYNRKFEGTGLGLTITKMLVEMMSGSIELISEQGKGTQFTVEFPIYAFNGKDKKALESEVN